MKEPFFFRANKLLGGKLGWIHLQHTRFLKASSPVLFHRFRGALTGHAINRLSDTWNNYLKLNVQRLADSRHLATLQLVSPAKRRLKNKRRNSILMTRHYPDLGSASDWWNQISHVARPIRSTYTQIWE